MKSVGQNVLGVFVGFITAVAASIVLSLLNLVIFADLMTRDAPLNVLMVSTGPLVYSLCVIFIAIMVGVFVTARLAKTVSLINSFSVAIAYALFNYWLSQSPSNLDKPYPDWFILSSYAVLLPSALIGHLISATLNKNDTTTE